MKNKILSIFLVFHLCIVLAFSDLFPIDRFSENTQRIIGAYSSWTGGGHGYSFFAPNVGNQNVAKSFTLLENGEMIVDAYGGGENNFEVRMSSFIHSMHNSKVPELTARIISSYCFGKYENSKLVSVSLGKYVAPEIEEFARGEQASYQEHYMGTFQRTPDLVSINNENHEQENH